MSKKKNMDGWRTVTLPDLAENLDRRRVPLTKADRTSGPYPYYGASGVVDYVEGYLFEGDTLLISEDGANLLARSTPIAFPATGKYWVNNHAHILRFHSGITQRLVELYLESIPLDSYITGTAQPKLNQSALNSIPITIPISLQEQERIVTCLDEAFERIQIAKTNAESNIHNARKLFTDWLDRVFSEHGSHWVVKRIGDIAQTQYGLSESMNEDQKGFKTFRMGEVQNGLLIDAGQMKFADIAHSEFNKYKLEIGDVLFNRTNSYELVGKTGIFNLEGDYCFASYLVRLGYDRKVIDPRFLNFYMNSDGFQKRIKTKASRSINQANINATILSDELISFPPSLVEQRLAVSRLEALSAESNRLQELYKAKVRQLDVLRQSFLHQAFSGNL